MGRHGLLQDNQTALHIASRVGDVVVVELLISRGASTNMVTSDRYTPLHIAAKEGHEDIASLLLDHGVPTCPITKVRVSVLCLDILMSLIMYFALLLLLLLGYCFPFLSRPNRLIFEILAG